MLRRRQSSYVARRQAYPLVSLNTIAIHVRVSVHHLFLLLIRVGNDSYRRITETGSKLSIYITSSKRASTLIMIWSSV